MKRNWKSYILGFTGTLRKKTNLALAYAFTTVYTQDVNSEGPYTNNNGEGYDDAIEQMNRNIRRLMIADRDDDLIAIFIDLFNLAVTFIGILAVIFLIYGGILYITAGGDEGKTEKANQTIIHALVGLAIVILSGVIVQFVINRLT